MELNKFIAKKMAKGYIVTFKSPIAFPVFFIKKKDSKLYLVQNYQKLNSYMIQNRYSLPLANDIINHLHRAWIFTKFDVY